MYYLKNILYIIIKTIILIILFVVTILAIYLGINHYKYGRFSSQEFQTFILSILPEEANSLEVIIHANKLGLNCQTYKIPEIYKDLYDLRLLCSSPGFFVWEQESTFVKNLNYYFSIVYRHTVSFYFFEEKLVLIETNRLSVAI